MRTKYYLLAIGLSIILLFYSIWQIKPVTVNLDDFLGLTSHLTVFYWIGLALILGCSISAYLDRKLKHTFVFVLILVALGLFLFGPRIFAESGPVSMAPYWYEAGFKYNMSHLPIDPASTKALDNYSAWPGYQVITTYLVAYTGVDFSLLLQYGPILWLVSYIFLAFVTGKRLGLVNNHCFTLVVLVLAPFWVKQNYYGPQMFAFILYWIIFLLYIGFNKKIESEIIIIVCIMGTIITHGLTSIAVLFGLIAISIYQRRSSSVLLYSLLFVGWIIYLSPIIFRHGLSIFWNQMVNGDVFTFLGNPSLSGAFSLSGQIGKLVRIAYPIILIILTLSAYVFNIYKKPNKNNKGKINFCVAWILGITLILLVSPGWSHEAAWRTFLFLLIPSAALIGLVFSTKLKVLSAVLIALFIIIHIPANYHTEAQEQVSNFELKGSEFFAKHINVNLPTFVFGDAESHVIASYDAEKLYYPWLYLSKTGLTKDSVENAITSILERCRLIIHDQRLHRTFLYLYDFDPVQKWLDINNDKIITIYINDGYIIYRINS